MSCLIVGDKLGVSNPVFDGEGPFQLLPQIRLVIGVPVLKPQERQLGRPEDVILHLIATLLLQRLMAFSVKLDTGNGLIRGALHKQKVDMLLLVPVGLVAHCPLGVNK